MRNSVEQFFVGMAAAAVIVASASSSHATTCYGGGYPITMRPGSTVTGQFAFQKPMSPTVSASQHWLFVDDYDDDAQGYVEADAHLASGFINTTTGSAKLELHTIVASEYLLIPGTQFAACTIKAFMLSNNNSVPADAYLVVKIGSTQDDGSVISVSGELLQEYSRVMTTNPITSAPWTADDLLGGVSVGIKNTASSVTNNGVGYGSIVLSCQ